MPQKQVIMRRFLHFPVFVLAFAALSLPAFAAGQTSTLHGQVQDPSGAVISGAAVSLSQAGQTLQQTKSGADGRYIFRSVPPGSYTITATAKGFASFTPPDVVVTAGETKELNLPLAIAVEQQEVLVTGENQGVGISSDQNAGAMVIKGSDLDALSDDPNELQNELQALGGPAAGPNGGQIYIDGFEGGQIPPKSSILEIRVNQNPFSAEYDRIGYGRIEIITKPGSQKFQGSINSFGNSSAFNTANPILDATAQLLSLLLLRQCQRPDHQNFLLLLQRLHTSTVQNQNIVDALNPDTLSGNIIEAFPAPMNFSES